MEEWMKRKRVGEQKHYWLDLGRMGKARDPIKITLGQPRFYHRQSLTMLTQPRQPHKSAFTLLVWELHSVGYTRCLTWLR